MNNFDKIIEKALSDADSSHKEAKAVSDKLEKALDLEQPFPLGIILQVGPYKLKKVYRYYEEWVVRLEIFRDDGTAPWMCDKGMGSTNIPPGWVVETVLNLINAKK